jgi:hypothetical protein
MLLTRIKRGAGRAAMLAQYKLNQSRVKVPNHIWRPFRTVTLHALVAHTVLMPVPLTAPATAVAGSADDFDPSPRLVRVSVEAHNALKLADPADLSLAITTEKLQDVAIGQSLVDQRAAEEAARRVAEEAARRAAEQTAREEARRQAAEEAAKRRADQQRALAARPAVHYGDGEIQQLIRAAAAKYGVDGNLMLAIAKCESGFNPNAKNRNSSASGLFQFINSTWRGTPQGRAGISVFDAHANADAAAWKISQGGLSAWNASKKCWGR